MKHLLYIAFLGLFLFSCKKGKADFVLKGIVTDQTFSQNLSGGTLKLYQVPVGSAQIQLIGTTTIGSDGSYSFTFPRDKMEKYIVKISKSNYFDIEQTVYFSELKIDEDNVRNYSTTAKSWAKLTFINDNPLPGDHLYYIKQDGKEGCDECCPDTEQHLYGAVNTSIYCINDGNTNYSYYYSVVGTLDQDIKSVLTVPFDTTEIILHY